MTTKQGCALMLIFGSLQNITFFLESYMLLYVVYVVYVLYVVCLLHKNACNLTSWTLLRDCLDNCFFLP